MEKPRCVAKLATASLLAMMVGCGGGGGSSPPAPLTNNAPTVASANADQSATVGQAFSYDATQSGAAFNDVDGDTLTYSATFSPDSNGFSHSAGTISGTPTDAETTTVTVTANDGRGGSVSDSFTITSSNPSSGNVTISGRVTFDFVPHNSTTSGLDYGNTSEKPVRGATVQLLRADNSVVASGVTDASGDYSVAVPSQTDLRVRVLAELAGFGSSWQVRIVDNTNSGALYGLDGSLVSSGNSDTTRNLRAVSGWGGSSYTGTRAAGPFAMLDNIYDSMQLVRTVDSSASFAPLSVNWSVNNRPANGSEAVGEIGTSFFRQRIAGSSVTNEIFILGQENTDTDEYDRHVVAHEWGHYFEANFSRSDSIGGPHGGGDRLDMRTAFGEGWGNALSGMILGDPVYRDSSSSAQGFGFGIDNESNSVTNPGWYNESSIQSILYDLFDSTNEAGDGIALGFDPIYQVMTNQQKDTPLFTSIFTFITALKANSPGNAAAIDTIVSAQNIVSATMDAAGSTETNNAGNGNVLPVYTDMTVGGVAVNVCLTDQFEHTNKLSNYRYLKFSIPSQGSYRIVATRSPAGSVAGDPDIEVFRIGRRVASATSTTANTETANATLAAGEHVMALSDYNFVNNITPRDNTACYDVTLVAQ